MKVVITSAGRASRMRPISTILPKLFMPVFSREGETRVVKPIAELILGHLAEAGAGPICIVVGTNNSMHRSYFSGTDTEFAVQEQPRGFGDAVLMAERFVGDEPFIAHADDGVLTGGYTEAIGLYRSKNPDCVLLLRATDNPRRYGIADVEDRGAFMDHRLFKVTKVEEKPKEPRSVYMISAVYIFKPKIFAALKEVSRGNELELTSGIQRLVENGGTVYGILLEKEKWLNVGDPESYHDALEYTYRSV